MIDQNRDGYIDKDDLLDMMTSLGKDPSNDYLEKMIKEAPGPINFTMFLTLFGEKLNGTDPEDVIRNAFAMFDTVNNGKQINKNSPKVKYNSLISWWYILLMLEFGIPRENHRR